MRLGDSFCRITVACPGKDILLYVDETQCDAARFTLICNDQAFTSTVNSKLFANAKHIVSASISDLSALAERLTAFQDRPADLLRIIAEAKHLIVQLRRHKKISKAQARNLYRAMQMFNESTSLDDFPEAILEMLYGDDWTDHYPRQAAKDYALVLAALVDLQRSLREHD